MAEATATTDHEVIRNWVESRGGRPARVSEASAREILRIDFDPPGEVPPDEQLEPIEWDEFFRIFDKRGLSFLHQDMTSDGHTSRFNRFINED